MGRRPVRPQFAEYNHVNPEVEVKYSLADWHTRFLELRDPTEIFAAIELVGSWKDWELLKRDWPEFAGMVDDWLEELDDLLRADAFQKIRELQDCKSTSTALAASRYVANSEFNKRRAGRPSKEATQRALEDTVRKKMDTQDDWARVQEVMTPRPTEEVN